MLHLPLSVLLLVMRRENDLKVLDCLNPKKMKRNSSEIFRFILLFVLLLEPLCLRSYPKGRRKANFPIEKTLMVMNTNGSNEDEEAPGREE